MQSLKLAFLVILATALCSVSGVKVFDLAKTFQNFTCMKNLGYTHAIIRAYHSYGAIDTTAQDNIQRSNDAGLSTDVYMFPCRGKSASQQVNELVDYLESMMKIKGTPSAYTYATGTIWLDIETNPSPGCSWTVGTPETNCQYVKDLISVISARGRSVGIYASGYMWNQIMGSKNACKEFTQYPLWYAHYDGKASFDDWESNQFGGWTRPNMKQWAGSAIVCDYDVDLSYY